MKRAVALCVSATVALSGIPALAVFSDEFNGTTLQGEWSVSRGASDSVTLASGALRLMDGGLRNNFAESDVPPFPTVTRRTAVPTTATVVTAEACFDRYLESASVVEGAAALSLLSGDLESSGNNTWIKCMFYWHQAPGWYVFIRERGDAQEELEGYFPASGASPAAASMRLAWDRASGRVSVWTAQDGGESAPDVLRTLNKASYDLRFGANSGVQILFDGWIPPQSPPWIPVENASVDVLRAKCEMSGSSTVPTGWPSVLFDPTVQIRDGAFPGWRCEATSPQWDYANAPGEYGTKTAGSAFGYGPTSSTASIGQQGRYYVSSLYLAQPSRRGKLVSDPFAIAGDKMDFLVAGGNYPGQIEVQLWVNNVKVRTQNGPGSSSLVRRQWDVASLKNTTATVVLVDARGQDLVDPMGYIAFDDLRQLDSAGNRISGLPEAPFMDFELGSQGPAVARSGDASLSPGAHTLVYSISGRGQLTHTYEVADLDGNTKQVANYWSYQGLPVENAKLEINIHNAKTFYTLEYFTYASKNFNNNKFGFATHRIRDDLDERYFSVPCCITIEDNAEVYGVWVEPQKNRQDHVASARLVDDAVQERNTITISIPRTRVDAYFGVDTFSTLRLSDGWSYSRKIFLYNAPIEQLPGGVSSAKNGYGQVIHRAWDVLYPVSPPAPWFSLGELYDRRMQALLNPSGIQNEITMGGRVYRLPYVGRWTLGSMQVSGLIAKQYFHRYIGMSWSGSADQCAYNALRTSVDSANPDARRLGQDTVDFFVNHGASPVGILYPYYHEDWSGLVNLWGSSFKGGMIDVATLGDGLYWFVRSYELMRQSGVSKPSWLGAAVSSCDKLMALYPDGDIPSRILGSSGAQASGSEPFLVDGGGEGAGATWATPTVQYAKPSLGGATGSSFVVWALSALYRATGEARYLDYAEKIGEVLLRFHVANGVFWREEQDGFNIDKRSGVGALGAFRRLYEDTGDPRWLGAALRAANWLALWEYSYNVVHGGGLWLGKPYSTVGGMGCKGYVDSIQLGSAQAGLEFAYMWKYTGDVRWLQRARNALIFGAKYNLSPEVIASMNSWWRATFPSGNPATTQVTPWITGSTDLMDAQLANFTYEDIGPQIWDGLYCSTVYAATAYMVQIALDVREALEIFGGICLDWNTSAGEALDTVALSNLTFDHDNTRLSFTATNMLSHAETYTLRIHAFPDGQFELSRNNAASRSITGEEARAGIEIDLGAGERVEFALRSGMTASLADWMLYE